MGVATLMGLDDPNEGLLAVANARWPHWQRRWPALARAGDFAQLRSTVRGCDRQSANQVLLALAHQGAASGGDESAATATVAWLLLPGAVKTANRLCRELPGVDPEDINQMVAGQLWIECRSMSNARINSSNFAATTLMNADRNIRREMGIHGKAGAVQKRTVAAGNADEVLEMVHASTSSVPSAEVDARAELNEVLACAARRTPSTRRTPPVPCSLGPSPEAQRQRMAKSR